MHPKKSERKKLPKQLVLSTAALGTALTFALSPSVPFAQKAHAHGGEAEYLPLRTMVEEFGGTVAWDSKSQTAQVKRSGTIVTLKPNQSQVLVNGTSVQLEAPVVYKNGSLYVTHHFLNEVFQSELDQTVSVQKVEHPLNPLTAEEINSVVSAVKASDSYKQSMRFTQISLKEPEKSKVWNWVYGQKSAFEREANVVMLDGKKVIEAQVNLATKKLVSWKEVEGAHGMVILDDFQTVQAAIEQSSEYADALKKRGINDVKKVVATPLTVGYFNEADGLKQDLRLLKVVSYLDVGDGNYWAHPIENLVAIVDLEQKKVIKIEDTGVIPVPLKPTPYDGRNQQAKQSVKPLTITEPQGKSYTFDGNTIHWGNWDFHLRMDSRVGPVLSTMTFNDNGTKRKIMYEGSLGGMIVPYGDPDVGWYFKAYLDSGDYGMGVLTSPLEKGTDVPDNAQLLEATISDNDGNPYTIPNAMAIFEQYAGPEFKHQEMGKDNVSRERRELVVRWISTVGNYDYIFDWILSPNGTIKIDVGATGIEAVKAVKSSTMHDPTAKEDTRYGTLIDHNIVGTTHQHIYNFRLDLDVDGENNTLTEVNPQIAENTAGGPRKSVIVTEQKTVTTEQDAIQTFDPSTIRLLSNPSKENKVGNPVSYQIMPYAGGTHPVAKGAMFSKDEWLYNRVNFMDKQIWVTKYNPDERYPEGEYPNRAKTDTGLKEFTANNDSIENTDNVVWMTTGTTHVARAEEWPIMPTEWVHAMLKPWNFFDQTPTLDLPEKK
ncbi:primary-amine oxidase [Brevibacillus nitrificans]|uniref:primary-amine oxidase n=1 Tax=Brevibacillus nitrificans TaxID=651560 RepID=UPI00285C074D|nr:primary-amine oxidase [Brevibacillus nitrificans]MDR7314559.1 primary-amine oxidase [Brevibacillus nitrificans]